MRLVEEIRALTEAGMEEAAPVDHKAKVRRAYEMGMKAKQRGDAKAVAYWADVYKRADAKRYKSDVAASKADPENAARYKKYQAAEREKADLDARSQAAAKASGWGSGVARSSLPNRGMKKKF